MKIRDQEINRIKKYAQGLGVTVYLHEAEHKDFEGYWIDGTIIRVYGINKQSKISTICTLIHELGHHMDWVKRGRTNPKELEAALRSNNPTKNQRKLIWEDEKRGASYQENIFKELGISFSINKLFIERDYQLLIYKYFYINGDWPNRFNRRLLKKKAKSKYVNV